MEIKINLIPNYRKEIIIQSNRMKVVFKLSLLLFLILVMFFAFLLGLYQALNINYESVLAIQRRSNNENDFEKIKNYDEKFSQINSQAAQISSIEKDQLYWSVLFEKISQSVSPGVKVTDLATKDYAVMISGEADNRDSLTEFKDKLGQESCFREVNLPLSSLASKENIIFQMDFKIDPSCLQNNQ